MSASEKLKALDKERTDELAGECIDCYTPAPDVAKQLVVALPQIRAVVEAAELNVRNYDNQISKHNTTSSSGHEPWITTRAALAALDEALS